MSPLDIPYAIILLQEVLGTNPISFGAPGVEGDDFVLDMATTTVAVGKVYLVH